MLAHRRLLPGVFVASHAIGEGFLTRGQLRRQSYRRLVQGVYADPGLPIDHALRCRGVALLIPEGTAIGGHSAAAWHGAPFARAYDPVTVVCPESTRWRGPRGVRVHHTTLRPGDIEVVDGVRVTTALRTAWDVAALETLPTAVAALDAMLRAKTIDTVQLSTLTKGAAGRFGVARVRRAIEHVDPRAESAPESWVRVALVLGGLSPEPQYEVYAGDRFIARVDFAWPEARLAVEYDGEYHFEEDQIPADDERLARLRAVGWRVLRVSAADLRDLDALVARIRAALAEA
jgi:very-short-patch-repair endonuclease